MRQLYQIQCLKNELIRNFLINSQFFVKKTKIYYFVTISLNCWGFKLLIFTINLEHNRKIIRLLLLLVILLVLACKINSYFVNWYLDRFGRCVPWNII